MSEVTFTPSASVVEVYDFIEIAVSVPPPHPANPFTEAGVVADFQLPGVSRVRVDGFCDAQDGSVCRVRFMPTQRGSYIYRVVYTHGGQSSVYEGTFRAVDAGRRGLVRVDADHPYHFVWAGTGEHYFWNSTTTYALAGCSDDVIQASIERLHRLRVNRIRVGISSARVQDGRAWYEEVYPDENFTFLTQPWVAGRPDWVAEPGWDVTRFNVAYWQKWDRLVRLARDRDVIVSAIFYVDGRRPGVYPFANWPGGADEMRYYRYAAARLGAFSNIMWDVTNEWRLFRDEAWVHKMGAYLRECDPYHHLMSVHGHEDFPFMNAFWADFAMYQLWDENGGNAPMLRRRALQAMSGHPKPVINEEYGYEDHYPQGWGGARVWPARTADNRRRLAWEMCMAGCYQTTGERANGDTPGGWINGRGDDSMTMLTGYGYMMDFFTAFDWWTAEPHNELVEDWNLCLAALGKVYAVYLPNSGAAAVHLDDGTYQARWFNPRAGTWHEIGRVQPNEYESVWVSPPAPDSDGDWALLLVAE